MLDSLTWIDKIFYFFLQVAIGEKLSGWFLKINILFLSKMLILDGGIGSEMDLRCPNTDDCVWSARHHEANSEILNRVYEDFIASGSCILSTNTYSLLQYLLDWRDDEIEMSVAKAVKILRDIRVSHPHILIAGCLSAHDCMKQTEDAIKKSIHLLASSLAKTNVDLILVEMVQNEKVGKIMVECANMVDVPLAIGFSVIREGGHLKLKRGDENYFSPDVVSRILCDSKNIRYVGIMHSNVDVIDEALSVIEHVWKGDMIAYPDCGLFENNVWTEHAKREDVAHIARSLVNCKKKHANLTMLGGCCGLGPSFIKTLTESLDEECIRE